jgi:hypothetical protein
MGGRELGELPGLYGGESEATGEMNCGAMEAAFEEHGYRPLGYYVDLLGAPLLGGYARRALGEVLDAADAGEPGRGVVPVFCHAVYASAIAMEAAAALGLPEGEREVVWDTNLEEVWGFLVAEGGVTYLGRGG